MEPGLSNESLETAKVEWNKASSGQQTVVITSSFCCGKALLSWQRCQQYLLTVESKASFSDNMFTANHPVNIIVYIR